MKSKIIAHIHSQDTSENLGFIQVIITRSGTLVYKLSIIRKNGQNLTVYGRNMDLCRLWINKFCRNNAIDGYRLTLA